jgi:hypothetical protein
LEQEIKKSIIPSINGLCRKWYEEKADNNLEPIRNRTRIEYKSYHNYIARNLGLLKPGDVTKKHIQDLLKDIAGEPLNPTKNHIGLQREVRRGVGLKWTQDVLRHSFGTYYYNLTHDLNRVSYDMGNSVAVCKKYYVREVRKTWNDKFWSLRPAVSESCQKKNDIKTDETSISPLESMASPSGIEPKSTV